MNCEPLSRSHPSSREIKELMIQTIQNENRQKDTTKPNPKPNPNQPNVLILGIYRYISAINYIVSNRTSSPFKTSDQPRAPTHDTFPENHSWQMLANQAAMYKDWVG